jgi:SAM-dependent methyltransferase
MNQSADPITPESPTALGNALQMEFVSCPLCGSDESHLLLTGQDHFHHVPGTFHIVRCRSCGHAYMNPRPVFADIMKCYPSDYGPYQLRTANSAESPSETAKPGAARPWYLRKWVRAIPGLRPLYYWLTTDWSTYIPEVHTGRKRALELGCSTGEFLQRLREKGWEAKGIEVAEEPARLARERGFEVHQGTLETADLDEESFDAFFMYMVLEHLQDPKAALVEVHRVLVPGGWLVFSVPNFACVERVILRNYSLGVQLPRHLQHFAPKHLRTMLCASGFEEIQIIHQRNVNNSVAGLGIWLRRKWPRWRLGQWLIDYAEDPSLRGTVLLSPIAKLAALFRQGGRLTVIARKPESASDAEPCH